MRSARNHFSEICYDFFVNSKNSVIRPPSPRKSKTEDPVDSRQPCTAAVRPFDNLLCVDPDEPAPDANDMSKATRARRERAEISGMRQILQGSFERLYRNEILQVNMSLKALTEIYTMHSFALF